MIKTFSRSFNRLNVVSPLLNKFMPAYGFILHRMFKKKNAEQQANGPDPSQAQRIKIHQELEKEKKNIKRQIEAERQYNFLERQKEIQLNRDFRKERQKYRNTIPQQVGKGGFDELVYWSQNAHTPEQIAQLIQKFNKLSMPKQIQEFQIFLQFKENVKATVYLAHSYEGLVEYAHFGFKYQINQPQFWLKIEEKVVRKPPKTQEELDKLVDIVFIMGNTEFGEVIFSTSEKTLQNKQFTVQQIAKLIIAYFRKERGQKEWIVKLMTSLQMQIHQVNGQILQSLLPILKQSRNVPRTFEEKIQSRVQEILDQLTLSQICAVAHYFGYEKGSQQFWKMLQKKTSKILLRIKKEKGRINSKSIVDLIVGVLSSYKFSTQFVTQLILPELEAKDCKVLYRLSPLHLATLSKCLYIYELEDKTKKIEETIQGLIIKNFQNMKEISNADLLHVLRQYTVTRIGSRDFYLFLEKIVNDKLADIQTDKFTIEALTAIYQQSNLCSAETLQLLKGLQY